MVAHNYNITIIFNQFNNFIRLSAVINKVTEAD